MQVSWSNYLLDVKYEYLKSVIIPHFDKSSICDSTESLTKDRHCSLNSSTDSSYDLRLLSINSIFGIAPAPLVPMARSSITVP